MVVIVVVVVVVVRLFADDGGGVPCAIECTQAFVDVVVVAVGVLGVGARSLDPRSNTTGVVVLSFVCERRFWNIISIMSTFLGSPGGTEGPTPVYAVVHVATIVQVVVSI